MTTTASPPQRLSPALIRQALPVLLITLAVQLDGTMTSVALKTLLTEFHTTLPTIQAVGTGYLLAFCMVIPMAGWATDRFGAKATWLAAITLFLAGSIACGAAWSAESLIVFRIFQGIGGGMLIPLSQATLVQAAKPAELGKLMGLVALPSLLGPVFGPVLGGLLVDHASWRWIFYVNVPVCVAAFALSMAYFPRNAKKPGGAPLDLLGLLLLSPGLGALAYGLSQAGNHGTWIAPEVLWPIAAGIVLLLGFVWHALKTRVEPLIDLRLFRSRPFAASTGTLLAAGLMMFGSSLLLPLYYQQIRGFSAGHAGLLLGPQGLGMAIALTLAGRFIGRIAPRTLVLGGIVLVAIGVLPLTQLDSGTSTIVVSVAIAVSGFGMGAMMVPTMTTAYNGLSREAIPRATSAVRTFMQLGGPFGLALFAISLQANLTSVTDPGSAFGVTFWWAVGAAALAMLPAIFLPGKHSATAAVRAS